MAQQCSLCNGKIGLFDFSYEIAENYPQYILCHNCHQKLERMRFSSGTATEELLRYFKPLLDNPKTPDVVKERLAPPTQQRLRIAQQERIVNENIRQNLDILILTTGSNVDGYRIKKYIDVISEEVIFKNSFANRLSAGFEDLGNILSFKEKELSGSGDLIARAREYVKEKFRKHAASLGANAVIGIDFESSVGGEIVRVAMFGTAVVIEESPK